MKHFTPPPDLQLCLDNPRLSCCTDAGPGYSGGYTSQSASANRRAYNPI